MHPKGEESVIGGSKGPVTGAALKEDLKSAGVEQGDLVMIHASLSRLGWVIGSTQTVLDALFEAVGPTGTLVMAGFSSQLSDPTDWEHPPVPTDWHKTIHDHMPVFDPDRTPTRGLSKLNEAFRALKDTRRSSHPIDSFLANGPLAQEITESHPISGTLGPKGPLGRLYARQAKVLFLGSGFDTCTCFHLAEYDNPNAKWGAVKYPMRTINGITKWDVIEELEFDVSAYARIGADFEKETSKVRKIGEIRCFEMQEAVDFAVRWFKRA